MAPLSPRFQTRIRRSIQIVAAVIRPGGRNAGRSFHNGSGTRLLELGHQLKPTPTRITEFAPAITPVKELATNSPAHTSGYSPPAPATRLGKLAASRERTLLSSPTEHCSVQQARSCTRAVQRTEHDGSLRLLYAARIGDCRVCPLREQCQWHGRKTTKPRRVSLLLHPLPVDSAPLRLWQDWSRRAHRRACMQRLASPTGGCDAGTGLAVSPKSVAAHPFTSTACPFPSLVCRAVGTQCP